MSTNRLGRSENLDKFWSEHLLDQPETKIHIESVNKSNVPSIPEIEDYPYEGQLKLSGSFEYELPGRGGGVITKDGQYEYRTASGIFLLNTPTDRPRESEVLSEINQHISNAAKIDDYLSLNRRDLWNLLEEAFSIEELTVHGSKGPYEVTTLAEIVQRENPMEELAQSGLPEHEKKSLESVLDQIEIPENFETIHDLDIDWYNTAIDRIEAKFKYDDYFATFIFQKGSIKIDAENSSSREYLLQLLEKKVMFPSNNIEL